MNMPSIGLALVIFVLALTQHFGTCNVLKSDAIEKRSVDTPAVCYHGKKF